MSRNPLIEVIEASTVEGVLECVHEHFWTQSPGVYVGTLQVRVRSDANEQLVLAKVTNVRSSRDVAVYLSNSAQIFSHLISHLTVQIVKDDWQISTSTGV